MKKKYSAKASISIDVDIDKAWNALINPEAIKQYMFGTSVVSDWQKGSSILWRGEWKGKPYEDKGFILQIKPRHMIQYNHYSPLSGLEDTPENYHTVTIELYGEKKQTLVSLTQDNNRDELDADTSKKNWDVMLKALKLFLEQQERGAAYG